MMAVHSEGFLAIITSGIIEDLFIMKMQNRYWQSKSQGQKLSNDCIIVNAGFFNHLFKISLRL